jgi:hypothetical protein
MQKFEKGKTYEFEVLEIRQDTRTGNDYIALCDDKCDTYRVYNILKFQYEELPEKITAVVKDIDALERPKLKQYVAPIFEKIYEFGKEYPFKVTDIKQDICSPNKAEYYVVEDEYCVHRLYFKEQHYNIGDECTLRVEGVAENGDYLIIKEPKRSKDTIKGKTNSPVADFNESGPSTPFNGHRPVLDFGEESTTLEYKTSIVFSARVEEPDIDYQLFVIVKTLVAFMNAEGGDLYIGIHDKTRKLIGIQEDLKYLNEGEEDEYNGQYEPNVDKYQLKIRHALERFSQGVAQQLVEFEFPEEQGIQYCHIKAKKAKRPIWVKNNLLFQRTGNRITLLEKDEITNFVYERMQISIKDVLDPEGLSSATLTPEKLAEVIKIVNNAHRAAVAAPKQAVDPSEVEYYVVWYNDGKWKRVRDASNEQDVFFSLPVRKAYEDGLLVFCYGSGTINEVKFKDFKRGANLKQLMKRPGFNPNEKPMNIFLVNTNQFVAVYSSDEHGVEYVKVHRVTDFGTTGGGGNRGSRTVSRNEMIQRFKLIPAEYESKLGELLYPKSKTTKTGIPVTSVAQSVEISFVNSI